VSLAPVLFRRPPGAPSVDCFVALSELASHVPVDAAPGWAELVGDGERVLFSGRVGVPGGDGTEVAALVEDFRRILAGGAP
jgi:hypothetical protein